MYNLENVIDRKQGNARKWSNQVLKEKLADTTKLIVAQRLSGHRF